MGGLGTENEEGVSVQPSRARVLPRLFGLNEFVLATLIGLGFFALRGYVVAMVGFVWYAALYVLRN